MLVSIVLVVLTSAPVPVMKPEKLSPEERAAVRTQVYDGEFATESPNRDGTSVVVVPKGVRAAYRKNAAETESLLLQIAEGGNPADSIKGVSYLLELRDGPGAGVPCVLVFKYQSWDAVDKDWKMPPRDHWVTELKKSKSK